MQRPSFFARLSVVFASLLGFFLVAGLAGAVIAASMLPVVFVAKAGADTATDALRTTSTTLDLQHLSQRTTIYAKKAGKNVVLGSFFAQNRVEIKWADVNANVKNALLAAEDIRYYQHGGVDPQALARAVLSNSSGSGSGGSTIAMQYVKNACVQQAELLDTQKAVEAAYDKCVERSYPRKLSDIRNAIALAKKYSKNDILLAYLNIVGFGGRVYGIQAAARYYYHVDAKDLSAAQAASLIAIVNDPGKLKIDVKANIKPNTVRRDYILDTEYKHDLLTKTAHDAAIKTPVKPDINEPSTGCMSANKYDAGFFCDYVVNVLLTDKTFGTTGDERYHNLMTAGWKVYTSINLDLQKSAQKTMFTYVPAKFAAFRLGSAASSVQVGTGRILAMVQNKTYNNTAHAKVGQTSVNYNAGYNATGFQPGSTYKMFTLLSWLEHGYTINSLVNGNARAMPASAFTRCGATYYGDTWRYGNDEGDEGGTMTVRRATALSVNGAFASMASELDLCQIREMAQAFGVEATDGSPLKDVPPSVIGGASAVSPLSMTAAYAGVANNGVFCKPVAIDTMTTITGKKLPVPGADCHRVVSKTVAKNAKTAAHEGIVYGTAGGDQTADGYFEFSKTGTTDSAKDTWMIGSTKKVTTGVWVGNVSGHTNLRTQYSTPFCPVKGSSQAAIERHCVWKGIQTVANKIYGG